MKETNKINTIILHHGNADKTMLYEREILDYFLYNRSLEMLSQIMKLYLNYEVRMEY